MIGKMDRRIVLQADGEIKNTTNGEVTKGWSDIETVWAAYNFKPGFKPGEEKYEGDRLTSVNETSFTIRFRPDVNEKCRVFYESKYYYVISLVEMTDKRKRYQKLICELRDGSDGRG